MVTQKNVLTALFCFSVVVFVSLWLITRNFPDKTCDCQTCIKNYKLELKSQQRSRRARTTPPHTTAASTFIKQTSTFIKDKETSIIATTKPTIKKVQGHKLAVVVPYRDRLEELLEFVPYMTKYLREKNIEHHIYVVNQVDEHRFNRASLINAGFLIATNESCDYIAMHDVDLLPLNKELNYGYPLNGPFHVSAPNLHPKYHYKKFIGGILLMNAEHFRKVNGLSMAFWGWGREDDELYMRINESGLTIHRPVGMKTNYQNTFKHNHGKKRKRDYPKTKKQFKDSFKRDRHSGLTSMNHNVVKRYDMTIDNEKVTMVIVELSCDYKLTPWCDE